MDDKLVLLLKHYIRERRNLTTELRHALREKDYRTAGQVQQGQSLVAQQIRVLQMFQDPYFNEREMLDKRIVGIRRMLASSKLKTERQMLAGFLEEYEREKSLLAEKEPASHTSPAGLTIKSLIEGLLAENVQAIRLVFSKSARLEIRLRRARRTVILLLPEVIRHQTEYRISKQQLRQLKNLGFALYDQKDKLMAFEPLVCVADVEQIMRLLMKISCLVFDPHEFHGDSEVYCF